MSAIFTLIKSVTENMDILERRILSGGCKDAMEYRSACDCLVMLRSVRDQARELREIEIRQMAGDNTALFSSSAPQPASDVEFGVDVIGF